MDKLTDERGRWTESGTGVECTAGSSKMALVSEGFTAMPFHSIEMHTATSPSCRPLCFCASYESAATGASNNNRSGNEYQDEDTYLHLSRSFATIRAIKEGPMLLHSTSKSTKCTRSTERYIVAICTKMSEYSRRVFPILKGISLLQSNTVWMKAQETEDQRTGTRQGTVVSTEREYTKEQ